MDFPSSGAEVTRSVYLGMDGSAQKPDLVCLNEAGSHLAHLTIPHTSEGFLALDAIVRQLGVAPEECLVGLETAHHLLIDFLCGPVATARSRSSPRRSSRAVADAMGRAAPARIRGMHAGALTGSARIGHAGLPGLRIAG